MFHIVDQIVLLLVFYPTCLVCLHRVCVWREECEPRHWCSYTHRNWLQLSLSILSSVLFLFNFPLARPPLHPSSLARSRSRVVPRHLLPLQALPLAAPAWGRVPSLESSSWFSSCCWWAWTSPATSSTSAASSCASPWTSAGRRDPAPRPRRWRRARQSSRKTPWLLIQEKRSCAFNSSDREKCLCKSRFSGDLNLNFCDEKSKIRGKNSETKRNCILNSKPASRSSTNHKFEELWAFFLSTTCCLAVDLTTKSPEKLIFQAERTWSTFISGWGVQHVERYSALSPWLPP